MKPSLEVSIAAGWVVRRDAGLTAVERRDYEVWLAANPLHRAAIERLDSTWMALGRPFRTGAADRLLDEIARRARRRWHRRLTVAAGVAVAVLLAVSPWGWRNWRRPSHVLPASTVTVSRPTERVLSDGSVVNLNGDAEISVSFTETLRNVVLRRGEALFHVAKNARRPFVVRAGSVEVRAVGTAFSVSLCSSQVDVLVAEGRVKINRTQTPAEAKAGSYVEAGSCAVVDSAAKPISLRRVPKSEMNQRLTWSEPKFEFSGTPLSEAVRLLNQSNRVKFIIGDPFLEDVQVSGFIYANNVEGFLAMLEGSCGVSAERLSQDEITLRARSSQRIP